MGAPDESRHIIKALDELQGRDGRPFLVRAYRVFADLGDPDRRSPTENPVAPARYVGRGRSLDLVARYQSRRGDVTGYCSFLRTLIAEHGPAISFLAGLAEAGGPRFTGDLDYVGLDFFPDVSRPVPPGRMAAVTESVLREHRQRALGPAGLSATPLRITEHGWPTGPGRPPERQAQVIETVVRTVARVARELGLTGYTHCALRDADSRGPGLFRHFGLMTDDYTPKPAFRTYAGLVDALSV